LKGQSTPKSVIRTGAESQAANLEEGPKYSTIPATPLTSPNVPGLMFATSPKSPGSPIDEVISPSLSKSLDALSPSSVNPQVATTNRRDDGFLPVPVAAQRLSVDRPSPSSASTDGATTEVPIEVELQPIAATMTPSTPPLPTPATSIAVTSPLPVDVVASST
jgi:hypothetical protein